VSSVSAVVIMAGGLFLASPAEAAVSPCPPDVIDDISTVIYNLCGDAGGTAVGVLCTSHGTIIIGLEAIVCNG
jgi:hypothetical protein